MENLTEFLGWCAVLNLAMLLVSTICVTVFRRPMLSLHGRILGLAPDDLKRMYVNYLAFFKVLVIVFSVVPYIALKLIN